MGRYFMVHISVASEPSKLVIPLVSTMFNSKLMLQNPTILKVKLMWCDYHDHEIYFTPENHAYQKFEQKAFD